MAAPFFHSRVPLAFLAVLSLLSRNVATAGLGTSRIAASQSARTEAEVEQAEEFEVSALEVALLQTKAQQPTSTGSTVISQEAGDAQDDEVSMIQDGPTISLNSAVREDAIPKRHSSEENGVCWSDDDCCPEEVEDSYCPMFCKEGTEINTSSSKGWEVKGACTKKWPGYCAEDEQCQPKHKLSHPPVCLRTAGSLSGTCRNDTLCETMSCGRGKCRWGKCTCDYGIKGDKCDMSLEAFAFLFYGSSSENLISTRVLVKSMRAAGAIQDILAIVPKDLASKTPVEHLHILEQEGVKIRYTEPILMPASMDNDPVIHERWSGVMNKFAVWRMTEYSQVALMDTDMVFDFDSESPGAIFEECSAQICAVRDGDSRFMNAGVMVVTPSNQRLNHIIQVLSDEQHHFAMPEQSFLTEYCKNPKFRMKLQFLDKKWNSCVGGGMLHNVGWESPGYNVLHSCSWSGKPPTMSMCFPTNCDANQEWHTVLVWQMFHMEVDPCIRQPTKDTCMKPGINQCHWCGNYCGDSRINCNAKLFNQTYLKDADEPDLQEAERLGALTRSMWDMPDNRSEQAWHSLPQGSWAWPQVAMYQILVDRFASPDEQHCDKLNDYCGGTIQGLMDRVGYLEELGVDGVVLSPVVDQMPHGYHGYWTKDLNTVNPAYGTEDEVKAMVVLLHERKMKVIVDVNMNHAGGMKMNASDPESISVVEPFNKPEYYHSDNCSLIHDADYDRGTYYLEHCKLYGLPDYNHENPVVWQGLMQWVRDHVDKYGFDGIRVDAARHINRNFLNHIPETGPPIPAYFEVVSDDLSYVSAYATGDYGAVYNYPLYFMLKDIFVPGLQQKPMSALGEWMTTAAPKAQGRLLLNFLDNNDLPRFLYRIGEGGEVPEATMMALYHNALLCVMGVEGLPALLYGSEQNARGRLNYSDPLKVDNWRQPLWHHGYNTSTPTFQLIKKVLWLRQRTEGLHEFKMSPTFMDHQVLVFVRGPALFVVTNAGQPSKIPSQRVLWDNATAGHGPYGYPSLVCNLLAVNPYSDCGVLAPGNISRLHLFSDPKLYVPKEYIAEYQLHERWKEQQGEFRKKEEVAEPRVVPYTSWQEMPNPPTIEIQAQKRVSRSWRPGDVTLNGNPSWVWHRFPSLPPHLDKWGPPLGMPVPHVISARVQDACFYLGAGEQDGAIFARRGNSTFVLCPDSPEFCPRVVGDQVDLKMLKAVADKSSVTEALPVVHLTFDIWYGVYHMLINALPSIAPHLEGLRGGTMKVFMHAGHHIIAPVLSMLGVDAAVISTPADPPLKEAFHFCAPEIIFDMATRPYYPRFEFAVPYLADFRKYLPTVVGIPQPLKGAGHIVVLSRGHGSRALANEDEMVKALRTLGRVVEVVSPEPENFLHTLAALSRAEVLVGAHGANMANMLFAPEGVKVVEIVPQVPFKLQDYHFWDLSAALNFTYMPVGDKVTSAQYDHVLATDPMTEDKAVSSMTADVEKVKAVVEALL
eukprot:CAMPEP_0115092538 /NCGR_PEP_ID=MMETSP0227-20121206/26829_1 /TAXON_ID=89957 /ORGANISM="Polarella glacialis, Strain CCMP 1383" /LENGTH=1481 /DNA_ID=CAMNT_0002484383 /DNA_START=21 /DNA_END=4466 /DNA_ORIENTATION=+